MEDVDALWFQRRRVDVVVCDADCVLSDSFRQAPALDLLHNAMAKNSVSATPYLCNHERAHQASS